MFSSYKYLQKRTKSEDAGRFEYLQSLLTEFQDTDSEEARVQIMANLANFAYDPINYSFLRDLNVLDLFLDYLSSDNLQLVEFASGGLCNLCLDIINRNYLIQVGGIQLIIRCLSSTNEETVLNAITSLMFLITSESKQEIVSRPVLDCMKKFSNSSNTRLKNLSSIFIQDFGEP